VSPLRSSSSVHFAFTPPASAGCISGATGDDGREELVATRRFFACPLCTEEFVLPAEAVSRHRRPVICPCCGTVDVVDLGVSFGSDPGTIGAPVTDAA
jgi:hypothetical protein